MKFSIRRLPPVLAQTGYTRSKVYSDMDKGLFTKQIKIGPRAMGWLSTEVDALIAARVAGKTDDEIRQLVTELEAARQTTPGSQA
jgi:prophage regulatory protein